MEKYKSENIACKQLRIFDLTTINQKITETTELKELLAAHIHEIVRSIESLKKGKNPEISESNFENQKSDIEKQKEIIADLSKERTEITDLLNESVSYVDKNFKNIKLLEFLVDSFNLDSNIAKDFKKYLQEYEKTKANQPTESLASLGSSINIYKNYSRVNSLASKYKSGCQLKKLHSRPAPIPPVRSIGVIELPGQNRSKIVYHSDESNDE